MEYKTVVPLFSPTSLSGCANYALRRCAEDSRDLFNGTVDCTVLHNFYVNDYLKSVRSEEGAEEVFFKV